MDLYGLCKHLQPLVFVSFVSFFFPLRPLLMIPFMTTGQKGMPYSALFFPSLNIFTEKPQPTDPTFNVRPPQINWASRPIARYPQRVEGCTRVCTAPRDSLWTSTCWRLCWCRPSSWIRRRPPLDRPTFFLGSLSRSCWQAVKWTWTVNSFSLIPLHIWGFGN